MSMTQFPAVVRVEGRLAALGLLAMGIVLAALGVAWWSFDADPLRGKVLLVLGVTAVVVSRILGRRLTASGQRVLLVVVGVLALLAVVDAVHFVQVVNDQRAAHLVPLAGGMWRR